MKKKRDFITLLLLVQMVICLLGGTGYLVYSYFSGHWQFVSDTKITNLMICSCNNIEDNGSIIVLDSEPEEDFQVSICGTLETSVPANLWFLVYKYPIEKPVSNRDFDRVNEGDFQFSILIPLSEIEGKYRVDVMVKRNVIASSIFEIMVR